MGCSAEGAALCYRTICAEGATALGLAHAHPEVSLHTPSLAAYTACIDRDDWPAVGELMLQSASKLARAGADFVICPDNTIHRALTPALLERSALPWLHIAEVVAAQALERGYKRVGLTGTQWLVESEVYPAALRARGLEFARPSGAERVTLTRVIMGELVPNGSASPASVAALQVIIARLRDEEGCDVVVLGCTELPLVLNDANSALPTLDSTRLLARAALRRAVDGAADAAAKPADATAASHAK